MTTGTDRVFSTLSGEVVASNISEEEYMERYAAHYCEWVGGTVIKMSPVRREHSKLVQYVYFLLDTYFTFRPIGDVLAAPYVMHVETTESRREPDIQVVLHTNPGQVKDTHMEGPADICIEVVSPESVERDYGDKFHEYELGAVGEYWILDPQRDNAVFYRRDPVDGIFRRFSEDADDHYRTPVLPDFALHIPTLWQASLPNPVQIVEAVRVMVNVSE